MKFSVFHNYVYQDDTKDMKIINHNYHYRWYINNYCTKLSLKSQWTLTWRSNASVWRTTEIRWINANFECLAPWTILVLVLDAISRSSTCHYMSSLSHKILLSCSASGCTSIYCVLVVFQLRYTCFQDWASGNEDL